MSMEVKPSSAALRIRSSRTPGFLFSMSSAAGSISSRANRAAVAAIWRCSSLRSSGVNTSAGVRDSSRKVPPPAATIGEGEVTEVDMCGRLTPQPRYFNGVDAGKRAGGGGAAGYATLGPPTLAREAYSHTETVTVSLYGSNPLRLRRLELLQAYRQKWRSNFLRR